MQLRDWMDEKGLTPDWLADRLGIQAVTVRAWLSGRQLPRNREQYARISELSQGAVTPNDVVATPRSTRPRGRPPGQHRTA